MTWRSVAATDGRRRGQGSAFGRDSAVSVPANAKRQPKLSLVHRSPNAKGAGLVQERRSLRQRTYFAAAAFASALLSALTMSVFALASPLSAWASSLVFSAL